MGLRDFLVSPFRAGEYTIDWDSPELAPINGVSVQTFVEVTQSPMIPGAGGGVMEGMAGRAGVSLADWTRPSSAGRPVRPRARWCAPRSRRSRARASRCGGDASSRQAGVRLRERRQAVVPRPGARGRSSAGRAAGSRPRAQARTGGWRRPRASTRTDTGMRKPFSRPMQRRIPADGEPDAVGRGALQVPHGVGGGADLLLDLGLPVVGDVDAALAGELGERASRPPRHPRTGTPTSRRARRSPRRGRCGRAHGTPRRSPPRSAACRATCPSPSPRPPPGPAACEVLRQHVEGARDHDRDRRERTRTRSPSRPPP